jgi:hypothetical protein
MQSLGLDIKVLSEGDEEIHLRESSEIEEPTDFRDIERRENKRDRFMEIEMEVAAQEEAEEDEEPADEMFEEPEEAYEEAEAEEAEAEEAAPEDEE